MRKPSKVLRFSFWACLLGLALPASLASEERKGAIRYEFPEVMLPDAVEEGEAIVDEGEPWLTFKVAPFRLARVEASFTAPYGKRSRKLSANEIIYISTGDDIYGCATYLEWSDAGEKVPCFVDFDADGAFDAVTMKKTNPELNSYAGKVGFDDFRPIDPLPYTMISERAEIVGLKPEEEWHMEHDGRTIEICQSHLPEEYRFCLREKGKIRRSAEEQLVQYKGGEFRVRLLRDGSVAVTVQKMPEPITF